MTSVQKTDGEACKLLWIGLQVRPIYGPPFIIWWQKPNTKKGQHIGQTKSQFIPQSATALCMRHH